MKISDVWALLEEAFEGNWRHKKKGFSMQEMTTERQLDGVREKVRELQEAYTAGDADAVLEEGCDCLIILMDILRRQGFNQVDVAVMMTSKIHARFERPHSDVPHTPKTHVPRVPCGICGRPTAREVGLRASCSDACDEIYDATQRSSIACGSGDLKAKIASILYYYEISKGGCESALKQIMKTIQEEED